MNLWQSQTCVFCLSLQESYPTKVKCLKIRNGEGMDKLLVGMYNDAAAVESCLAGSSKT